MRVLFLNVFSLTFLIFFIFLFNESQSQIKSGNFEKRLLKAVDLLMNFEFDKAEQELSRLREENRGDLRPQLFISNIYVWKYIGDKGSVDLEIFNNISSEVIEKAKKRIDENGNDYNAYFILANAYGYRAVMDFMTRSYFNGVLSASKSLSWSEKLISKKPDYYDAYLWRGLFNFGLSQVPSTVRKLLKTLSLSGNIKQGVSDLRLVSEKGVFTKAEAMYFLSQFYSSFLFENEGAIELLKALNQKYPNNELFSYSLAVEFLKSDSPSEAVRILDPIVSDKNISIRSVKNFSIFLLGDSYFYQNDFQKAKNLYKKFIELEEQKSYKVTASFRLGVCEYFSNNIEVSKNIFTRNAQIKASIDEDKLYKKLSGMIVERSFDTNLVKIFRAYNLIKSGKFSEAQNELLKIRQLSSKTHLEIINFYLALSYYKMKKFDEAKKLLDELIKISDEKNFWIKGFAYFYLGLIELKRNQKNLALKYWNELQKLSDFEYENYLKNVTRNLIAYRIN